LWYPGLLLLFYILHNDVWFWYDNRLFGGLPVGFVYHVFYCLVASALMAFVVKKSWSQFSEEDKEEGNGV
jgi:hypothetical protein